MELLTSSGRRRLFSLLFAIIFASFSQPQRLDNFLNPIYTDCLRNATPSLPTTFKTDLDLALRSFSSLPAEGSRYAQVSRHHFYAMFQCRQDLSPRSCSSCVQNATALLPRACPLALAARLRLEACFLRYDNQSFFYMDDQGLWAECDDKSTHDVLILAAISNVMMKVISEAPRSPVLFASASLSGVHAMAECWLYLNESECSLCLKAYPYRMNCDSKLGEQLHQVSCDYRYATYNFLEAPSPLPSPAAAPAPIAAPESPPGRKTAMIAAVSVAVGLFVVGGALCSFVLWRRKIQRTPRTKRLEKTASLPREIWESKAKVFSLAELEEATGNFDPTNKLGEDKVGIVYKGKLSDGELVAIKRLYKEILQGNQQFWNEMRLVTSVQHKNLIKLLGWCMEGSERILVYEYMKNRSLNFCLFGGGNARSLNWATRFGIIVGMAKALAYLHEESQIRIIHGDIKPSNILLDRQFNPVITGFGVARFLQDHETHINTKAAGSIGYMAPEYVMHGDLSEKVDVYGYGMVSLQMVMGKANVDSMSLRWVWETYQQQKVVDLVDYRLGGVFFPEQVAQVVHVALLCTQEDPKQRPLMSNVSSWLSGMSVICEKPIMPTFLDYIDALSSMHGHNQQPLPASSACSQPTMQTSCPSEGMQPVSEIEPR